MHEYCLQLNLHEFLFKVLLLLLVIDLFIAGAPFMLYTILHYCSSIIALLL